MPKFFDIHAHINFKAFDEDREEVISRALKNDTWLINIGTQFDTSKKAVEMSLRYPEGVYASIGLHPIHTSASYHDTEELGPEGKEFTSRGEIFDKERYKELAKEGKVVAIGECGLDYYHLDPENIEKQKTAFIAQIELANELNLPLMLHIRNNPEDRTKDAYHDVYEILKKYSKVKAVSHFFAGSPEDVKRFLEIGVYISFSGPITYKPNLKICDYVSVIKETPLDVILADTDCPYVAPASYRGKRNEPVYISEIVKKIAEVKSLPELEVSEAIIKNARGLFDI